MADDSGLRYKVDEIKDTVQDCNINLLLGSGASAPFLSTLGNIEVLLQQLSESSIAEDKKKIIRASIYKKLFDAAIEPNQKILDNDALAKKNLDDYKSFLKTLNYLMLKRKSTILSKQVNLFTSNYDIFLEKSLDDTGLEYNDGFCGRFKPKYSLSNFKKSHFKKSLQYENTSEIPVFNLIKIHGSLTWDNQTDKSEIYFDTQLRHLKGVVSITLPSESIVEVCADSTIDQLEAQVANVELQQCVDDFIEAYEKLAIVNPTKEKFKTTLLNQTYYEQLRIFSNELEKENTVLFVVGFSFSDEHIREVTVRAANSNPTLAVYIFAYSSSARGTIEANISSLPIKNGNVKVLYPVTKQEGDEAPQDRWKYDLPTINSMIFDRLLTPDNQEAKESQSTADPLEV